MKWISVEERLPKLPRKCREDNSFGVPVLVVDGTLPDRFAKAYFGRRVSSVPGFYLYGAPLFPTHWAPKPKLPEPPP